MQQRVTERHHDEAAGLDERPAVDIARLLHQSQAEALAAVGSALVEIAAGAALMAETLKNGGALVYAAAGSSGLMAAADAAEIPGTYGIAPDRIRILMAGGVPTSAEMPGGVEDDTDLAARNAEIVVPGDALIALTASGRTPYAIAAARTARERGASTVCIANNPDAPLFDHADVAIALPTPPEVIAGSTRMGAGTAQKAALNMLSTLTGIALGHVHDGMMVNVRADNDKLKARAAGMVASIARVPADRARAHLEAAAFDVKPAVLMAAGAGSLEVAHDLLAGTGGHLRAALARLAETTT